jgi:hypothetical protein
VLGARTGGGRQHFALVGLTSLDGRADGGKVAAVVKLPDVRLIRPTNRLPPAVAFCYTPDNSQSTKETEMRRAFMSIQKGGNYRKDMTHCENVELGDPGACRRR